MNSTPFPPGSSIVAYLRDSGGETQELSHDQQEIEIRKWCVEHGYILTRVFQDVGTGTSTEKREKFHEMVRYFRQGASESGIILWRFNRFARDVNDAQYYRADLRRRGYLVHSIKDDIPGGNYQHIFEAITDTMAQQHSIDLSEDVKRGQHHLVEAYNALGGTPPRGFKREPVQISTHRDGKPHITHKWVPDPEMIPLIRKAWQMRAANASLASIKKETNLYGSVGSFSTFFRNKLYIGTLIFGNLTIEDYCEPIVDLSVWNTVQKLNTKHKRIDPEVHPRRKSSDYLLSGLLYCMECGSPYNGHSIPSRDGTSYAYYRCSRSHRNRDCKAPYIKKEEIEKIVLDELCDHILDPDHLVILQEEARNFRGQQKSIQENEIKIINNELGALRRKVNNVTKAIAEIGHSQALLKKLEDLEVRKILLETKIAEIKSQEIPEQPIPDLRLISKMLRPVIRKASTEEKKIILKGLIHRIDAIRDKKNQNIQGVITYYLPADILAKKKAPRGEGLILDFYVYMQCPHGDSTYRHKFQHFFDYIG